MQQIIRFGAVGLLATGIHILTALAVSHFLGAAAQIANLTGFVCSVMFSFVGHSRLTFGLPQTRAEHAPRFVASALVGLATSASITHVMHGILGQSFGITMIAVGVTVPIVSFGLLKFWVYTAGHAARQEEAFGAVLCLCLSMIVLLVLWGRVINPDVASLLEAAQGWLDGQISGAKSAEFSPPINVYYTVPAILLSDLLGVGGVKGSDLMFCAVLGVSLFWCWSILSRGKNLSWQRRSALITAAASVVLLVALLEYAHEGRLAVFLLPWIFGQLFSGNGLQLGQAVFAGLGLLLKPQLAIVPVSITLWQIVSKRSFRPLIASSNFVFLIMGLTYLAFIWIMHPTYFSNIIPIS